VPVCGRIANYNDTEPPPGPNLVPRLMSLTLVRRITFQGFIIYDHGDRIPAFLYDVGEWIRSGKLRYREDVVDGLENAVTAFQGLLQGKNFGKLLVRVSEDPTR
jgi:NADPH-dependent curcumin reductase CurA